MSSGPFKSNKNSYCTLKNHTVQQLKKYKVVTTNSTGLSKKTKSVYNLKSA